MVRLTAASRSDASGRTRLDQAAIRWFGRFERLGASPAGVAALMRMNSQIDISGILSTIRVPTLVIHRTDDVAINVEGGRYRAKPHFGRSHN